jgi:aspartokinase
VRILNSHRPGVPGTLIDGSPRERDGAVAALACARPVAAVEARARSRAAAHRLLARAGDAAARTGAAPLLVLASDSAVTLVVGDASADALRAQLAAFADVSARRDLAVICAVGRGLGGRSDVVPALLAEIGGAQQVVTHAATHHSVAVVLPAAEAVPALARAHARFLAAAPRAVA